MSGSLEEEKVARNAIFTFSSRRWPLTGLTAEEREGKARATPAISVAFPEVYVMAASPLKLNASPHFPLKWLSASLLHLA